MGESTLQALAKEAEEKVALLRCTCAFIKKLCNKLSLQLLSQCTALVYCHRFAKVQTFNEFDRFVLGTACVFLAAKVEEDMRRLDDVVVAAQGLHDFGPAVAILDPAVLPPNGASGSSGSSGSGREVVRVVREKVLLCERVLLHSLSFDVSVTHPHLHAFNLLKKLVPGGNKGLGEFRQASWNFLNDALFCDVCIHFKPEEMAVAAVVMAYYFLKLRDDNSVFTTRALECVAKELGDGTGPVIFEQNASRVNSIMHEIMQVYQAPRPFSREASSSTATKGDAALSPDPKKART
mmetsp:Transcript_10167/g.17911  ORF Transcript_10167/g.17911 Transcript_10167/m.17911 type:complete len:293 (-) Transcript_10167:2845-3723(-)